MRKALAVIEPGRHDAPFKIRDLAAPEAHRKARRASAAAGSRILRLVWAAGRIEDQVNGLVIAVVRQPRVTNLGSQCTRRSAVDIAGKAALAGGHH
jgi:hypothetical protein